MSEEVIEPMTVRIALPSRFLGEWRATSLTADGAHGNFGMKPRHIDYVVVLRPGVLILLLEDGTERFVAVDTGVLVKRGREVFVSTRRGVESTDLEDLRDTVRNVFQKRDAQELRARSSASKLEMSFVRRLMELDDER